MNVIRRATPEDIPAMAGIASDWERSQDYLPEPPPLETLIGLFEKGFPSRKMWVTGAPVDGYMSLKPEDGYLGALFLTRTGTGLGKQLMELAKAECDHLWLTVYIANTGAQAFYKREGFEVTETVRGDRPGEPDLYRMDWRRAE